MTPAAPDAGSRAGPVAVRAPGPSALGTSPPQRACLDCGSPLSGRFCPVCGQKDEPLKRGIKDLALEFLQHPLIDTKLWRSLVPLLLRPGVLTEEYLAGRRTRYVRPLKLYLTISVVFFTVLALRVSPDEWVKFETVPSPVDATQAKEEYHLPVHWLDVRWQRNMAALEGPDATTARQAVARRVAAAVPKMVFVLLPLSAVLFKLFWWRRYFVEHLIFTLHLHSYAFASGMLRFFHWAPVTGVVVAWSCIYLVFAFKRVYRDGWGKTVAKLFGLALAYCLLLAGALLLTGFSALLAA